METKVHILYSAARLKSITLMISKNKHYKRADIMQAKESKTRRWKKHPQNSSQSVLINSEAWKLLAHWVWNVAGEVTVSAGLLSSGVWRRSACESCVRESERAGGERSAPAVLEQRPKTPSTPALSRGSQRPHSQPFVTVAFQGAQPLTGVRGCGWSGGGRLRGGCLSTN